MLNNNVSVYLLLQNRNRTVMRLLWTCFPTAKPQQRGQCNKMKKEHFASYMQALGAINPESGEGQEVFNSDCPPWPDMSHPNTPEGYLRGETSTRVLLTSIPTLPATCIAMLPSNGMHSLAVIQIASACRAFCLGQRRDIRRGCEQSLDPQAGRKLRVECCRNRYVCDASSIGAMN